MADTEQAPAQAPDRSVEEEHHEMHTAKCTLRARTFTLMCP